MTEPSSGLAARGIDELAAMRIAAGLLAWLSPRLTARLFGMSGESGDSHYAWRLFGVRDIALGIGTLRSSGAQRRAFATAGLARDAADGAAGAISGRRRFVIGVARTTGVPGLADTRGGSQRGHRPVGEPVR
jgi:hypothetical protein